MLSRSNRLKLYPAPCSAARQLFVKRLFRSIDDALGLLPASADPDTTISALSKVSQRAADLASLIGMERDCTEGGAV